MSRLLVRRMEPGARGGVDDDGLLYGSGGSAYRGGMTRRRYSLLGLGDLPTGAKVSG